MIQIQQFEKQKFILSAVLSIVAYTHTKKQFMTIVIAIGPRFITYYNVKICGTIMTTIKVG